MIIKGRTFNSFNLLKVCIEFIIFRIIFISIHLI